ncbi:MAG: AAA family ATPase [Gammaproteobacteria bacterium]|jgi:DNA polymerase-3 subunit delta'
MNLAWQESLWSQFEQSVEGGRLVHAFLLEGPAGLGKSQFALRMAARTLGFDHGDPDAGDARIHPDLITVTVPEDKKQIGVDQVRELCAALAMTSHGGGYKVAIIDPADRMNANAANALLKTLEEPTADTMLILVRSRLDTLPATVASRCQRIRFPVPPAAESLAWLQDMDPQRDWTLLLSATGGAPLAAWRAAQAGEEELDRQFAADLQAIAAGRKDPVRVASDWNRKGLETCLRWLNAAVCELIRSRMAPASGGTIYLQNIDETIPLERLFRYLDEVQAALARRDGALNAQMTVESLLVPWARRLEAMQSGVGL